MSMFVQVQINEKTIHAVEVTRQHIDNGTDPDAVNTYRWRYPANRAGEWVEGEVRHRYGDGALVLASTVLAEISARIQLALTLAEAVDA